MYSNIFETAVKVSDVALAIEFLNDNLCDYLNIIDSISDVKRIHQELSDWELKHYH